MFSIFTKELANVVKGASRTGKSFFISALCNKYKNPSESKPFIRKAHLSGSLSNFSTTLLLGIESL
jgi:predicted YcjX-like family ATPase